MRCSEADIIEGIHSRYVELYWDRVHSSSFLKNDSLKENLENLRLRLEEEIKKLQKEKDKNDLRFRLAQDCGPVFIKSLSDQALVNRAIIALLRGSVVEDIPHYIHLAKDFSEEASKEFCSALAAFIKGERVLNFQLCVDTLNRVSSPSILKALIVNCFEESLYIDSHLPLLNALKDQSLKNDICFELLSNSRYNNAACKAFLGLIEVYSDADSVRKDNLVVGILLRQHLQLSAVQSLLPFIEDPRLRACLLARCIWKHSLSEVFLDLIHEHIKDEDLLYWVYVVLNVVLIEGQSLKELEDLLQLRLQDSERKINDYEKALSFIKNFFCCFEWLALNRPKNSFVAFLDTLSLEIQSEIQYAIVYDLGRNVRVREFVAETIKDAQEREKILKAIKETVDTIREKSTKGLLPDISL